MTPLYPDGRPPAWICWHGVMRLLPLPFLHDIDTFFPLTFVGTVLSDLLILGKTKMMVIGYITKDGMSKLLEIYYLPNYIVHISAAHYCGRYFVRCGQNHLPLLLHCHC